MADGPASRYAMQKLNAENYSVWSYKMELIMIDENIWDVITKEKPPATETGALATWTKNNDKARARIGLSVEDDQLLHIRNAATAKDAWQALKEYHQKSTLTSRVLLLKRICRTVLADGGDMETHITTLSNSINQLSALGLDLPDALAAALLLTSLPDSYDTLVTALESRPETDITWSFIKGKLVDEYRKRVGTKDIRNNFEQGETAMKSVHQDKEGKIACFFCKKTGHIKAECRSYKAWESKHDKANKASERHIDSSERLFMAREHTEPEKTAIPTEQAQAWLIDSGATSHIACSKEFFCVFDPNIKGKIQLAESNRRSEVLGRGSGSIKCAVGDRMKTLNMKNVLYVPSFGSSLISVKKLTADGYEVNFRGLECKIIKEGNVQVVGKAGIGATDLFEVQAIREIACTAINSEYSENCQHTWHRRLGHRDLGAIKDLEEKELASGILVRDCGRRKAYEYCLRGKLPRQPFPKESDSRSLAMLDLLHTDICGPMQTPSLGKKEYLMTIIDDF